MKTGQPNSFLTYYLNDLFHFLRKAHYTPMNGEITLKANSHSKETTYKSHTTHYMSSSRVHFRTGGVFSL